MPKHDTPMLDQLESGPWPSFVTDIKRQAEKMTLAGTFSDSWSFPTRTRSPIGNTAVSSVFSDMAVELSAVILTLPQSSPVLPISIQFESTSPRVNSTAQRFCARSWKSGIGAVPV